MNISVTFCQVAPELIELVTGQRPDELERLRALIADELTRKNEEGQQ